MQTKVDDALHALRSKGVLGEFDLPSFRPGLQLVVLNTLSELAEVLPYGVLRPLNVGELPAGTPPGFYAQYLQPSNHVLVNPGAYTLLTLTTRGQRLRQSTAHEFGHMLQSQFSEAEWDRCLTSIRRALGVRNPTGRTTAREERWVRNYLNGYANKDEHELGASALGFHYSPYRNHVTKAWFDSLTELFGPESLSLAKQRRERLRLAGRPTKVRTGSRTIGLKCDFYRLDPDDKKPVYIRLENDVLYRWSNGFLLRVAAKNRWQTIPLLGGAPFPIVVGESSPRLMRLLGMLDDEDSRVLEIVEEHGSSDLPKLRSGLPKESTDLVRLFDRRFAHAQSAEANSFSPLFADGEPAGPQARLEI